MWRLSRIDCSEIAFPVQVVERTSGRTGGRGKEDVGENGAKRPENLENRVMHKASNGEFGQGTVGCGRIYGSCHKRGNTYPLRFVKERVEKFLRRRF